MVSGAGLGLITPSNFFVPQVNAPGSMASFVTPVGVTGAIPAPVPANHGGHSGSGQSGAVRTDGSWLWLVMLGFAVCYLLEALRS